jgi:hypothetical protein
LTKKSRGEKAMNISDTADIMPSSARWRLLSISVPAQARTAILFAISAAIGGAGWSGAPALNYFALLFPFVYLHSQRRLDSLCAVFYYAAATWSVIPGSQSFFRTDHNFVLPLAIWAALVALAAVPWVGFYSRRYIPISAIAALTALALPPLSLTTVAHPLIATGHWFPGTRWFGLGLVVILIAAYRRFGRAMTLTVLLAASVATHVRFHRPVPDPHILAVNTNFSGEPTHDNLDSRLEFQERTIQQIALAHPDTLLVFPESIIPSWNGMHEARWASTFAQLKLQRTGLLIGTTIPITNTEANRNVLLSRGYTERLSYAQRVPVPLGMWHVGDQRSGYPLMLRFPPTIRIWNRRAGILVCYEQLSFWPAIQTLAHNPDMLLAPSNLYWAANTPIPAIQHVAAQDWADLWAIPLYEASNR